MSTKDSYKRAWSSLRKFCFETSNPAPSSWPTQLTKAEAALLLAVFVSWGIEDKSWMVGTIKSYLSGIKHKFQSLGFQLSSIDLVDVYRALSGFQRDENLRIGDNAIAKQGPVSRGQLPYPIDALAVGWKLSVRDAQYSLVFDATMIGFWFLLTASEYLPSVGSSRRSSSRLADTQVKDTSSIVCGAVRFYLQARQVHVPALADSVGLVIRNSKGKKGKHCNIRFPALKERALCPVRILARRVKDKGIWDPVFPGLTRAGLVNFLNICLGKMVPPSVGGSYNVHSLRRGGTTALSAAGLPRNLLNAHGRWGEEIHHLYACFPGSVLGNAAHSVCMQIKACASKY